MTILAINLALEGEKSKLATVGILSIDKHSPYMMSKHHEMDSIVTQIYTAMEEEAHLQSTLFILCGDHGMNDAGNHGGSSAGETSPALLFISPKFQARGVPNESPLEETDDLQYYRTVEQSDITPTLAGLLGIPIPLNSLGVFIPELLMMWDHGMGPLFNFKSISNTSYRIASHRVHILLENSRQLLRTVQATFPSYTFEPSLAPFNCDPLLLSGVEGVVCAWFRAYDVLRDFLVTGSVNSEIEHSLLQFSKTAQQVMSNAATNYDVSRLYVGLFISSAALLLSLWSSYKTILKFKWPGVFWIFGIMSYGAMMFASSYVEEEQQFWYWIFTGWTFYLHAKSSARRHWFSHFEAGSKKSLGPLAFLTPKTGTVLLAMFHRIVRRWNQTGQKFAGDSDIARNFLPSHQNILWALIILTYMDSCRHLFLSLPRYWIWRLIAATLTIAAFSFKATFVASDSPELLSPSILIYMRMVFSGMPLILQARAVFFGISILAMLSINTHKKKNRAWFQAQGKLGEV